MRSWTRKPSCSLVSSVLGYCGGGASVDSIGAPTVLSELPNANVALFDLAFPGSQPVSIYEMAYGDG